MDSLIKKGYVGYIPALTKIDQRGQLDQAGKCGWAGIMPSALRGGVVACPYFPALTKINMHSCRSRLG